MATRFAQQFKRTGAPSLLRQFAEPIVYYPGGIADGRSIDAIVTRGVEVVSETGQVAYAIVVRVLDDATLGISATEIDDGRDVVLVALNTGGTPERRQITRTKDDSNGMVRFMVR